jgi:heme exporter protein A
MTFQAAVKADGLKKVFNRRVVFEGISFSISPNQTLLISGRNGSGKSTLIKIVAGVLSPTAGSVSISGPPERGGLFGHQALIGMVSPYLQMYEEFSAEENLLYASAIRGEAYDQNRAHELLRRVALFERKDDPVLTFSSGMKQRIKYAFALLHRPPILLLDEPMANLDADGITIVREIIREHRRSGAVMVATNDLTDVDVYDERITLDA